MAERSAAPGRGNIFFCFWSGRAVKESGKKGERERHHASRTAVTARIDSYKDRQCNAISLCTAMYFRLKKKERMWRRTKHL